MKSASELRGAAKEHGIICLQGRDERRVQLLSGLIEIQNRDGHQIWSHDARAISRCLMETIDKWVFSEQSVTIIIDHWELAWVHPNRRADFQRWCEKVTKAEGQFLVIGVGEGGKPENDLLPEWALAEMVYLSVAELSAQSDQWAVAVGVADGDQDEDEVEDEDKGLNLFPPLTPSQSTRRASSPDSKTIDLDEQVEPLEQDLPEASPIRRLYELLVEIHGQEDIRLNLDYDDDFQAMVGPLEARFCEWCYHQLELRRLARRMSESHLLSPANVRRLAKHLKINPQDLKGLGREEQIRFVLAEMGIDEPSLPPLVEDGVAELKNLWRAFQNEEKPQLTIPVDADNSPEGNISTARRGGERLLKLIAIFLWHADLEDIFFEVVAKELQGFQNHGFSPDRRSPDWLLKGDMGSLNYLLRAVDKERIRRGIEMIFLRDRNELWGDSVFWPFDRLATALSQAVHEGREAEQRRRDQKQANGDIMRLIESGKFRIPRAVQFFRRFSDNLGEHYEGWTFGDGDERGIPVERRIRFYEVRQSFDLHQPYLFLAATNPSAIDISCVPLNARFLKAP